MNLENQHWVETQMLENNCFSELPRENFHRKNTKAISIMVGYPGNKKSNYLG